MNEEMKVMEVINDEGAVEAVIEEVATNKSTMKNVVIGLGVTGAVVGLGFVVYKAIKKHKAKKAEIIETEVEEIEE